MLEGIIRESISKADTKALRKDGYLIANVYGKNFKNIHCAFKVNEYLKYLKSKKGLVFQIKLGDQILDVVVQAYQSHPVSAELLHVDLLLVQKDVLTSFKIPVKLDGTPVGLKNKGILLLSKKRISVKCMPDNLVNEIRLDVSSLDVGHSILVRDLPEMKNIKILEKQNVAVVGVIKAK